MTKLENNNETNTIIETTLNEIITLSKTNPIMFDGLSEIVKPLYDYDYWVDVIEDVLEMVKGDEGMEESIDMFFMDGIDREVVRLFGEKWYNNLKSMGYKYDGEGWDIDGGKTNYGLVWDYWVDLDTSIREVCSEILDDVFNDLK